MIRLDLSAIRPGTRLARPIYNDRGAVWLKSGTELTERYVAVLQARGVAAVYVEEPATSDVVVREAIGDETRGQATQAVAAVVCDVALAAEATAEFGGDPEQLSRWLEGAEGRRMARESTAAAAAGSAAHRIVTDVLAAPYSATIASPKGRDGYVLSHAVDVATIAVTIGKLLHLPRELLLSLARGCLLMDVGLTLVDPSILNKPGPLSPLERLVVQDHPRMGWELLRALQPSEILANTIALQHHERQDGRGYPRGIRGINRVHTSAFDRDRGEIVHLAEIAAVADVYDALLSNRPQRPAFAPEQAHQTMRRLGGTHLNRAIVEELLRNTPVYPVGYVVTVQGPGFGPYRAVVTRVHRHALDRPVVRVFERADGGEIVPREIDLAVDPRIQVRGTPVALAA